MGSVPPLLTFLSGVNQQGQSGTSKHAMNHGQPGWRARFSFEANTCHHQTA